MQTMKLTAEKLPGLDIFSSLGSQHATVTEKKIFSYSINVNKRQEFSCTAGDILAPAQICEGKYFLLLKFRLSLSSPLNVEK